ncbi:hypothetical protein H5410_054687 [Solanum commersonii]|uniref:Uncharacterized protein n=1 Tax=Solanum commersonii TaxID=4109 RepID=A0A9J5WFM1_SOLCO|nr:hypothetical protein H5410_054687 [Solanum commersonii]
MPPLLLTCRGNIYLCVTTLRFTFNQKGGLFHLVDVAERPLVKDEMQRKRINSWQDLNMCLSPH